MKKNKRISAVLLNIGLLAILAVLFTAYVLLAPNSHTSGNKSQYLLIPDNSTFETVTHQLSETGVLRSVFTFTLTAKVYGYKNIKPGRYEINPGISNLRLVHKLKTGRQSALKLTFNNIRTKEQLAGRLSRQIMADSAS
ncbi:MAG: endolytic transglycosylase MltG, partial [Paludibacter sp.]|nr:endolytic transglycosylase MltG [Paludibacter sp.]